jgi:hypothetical protein
MAKKLQHIGIKYGHLTGLKYLRTDPHDGAALWLWRCDCGNERELKAKVVTAGRTQTCGKCELKYKLMSIKATSRAPQGKRLTREFQKYIRISQRRHIKWALSLSDFSALVHADCTLCGTPSTASQFQKVEPLDTAQGYTVNGCYVRCRNCEHSFQKIAISQLIDQIFKCSRHLSKLSS